MVFSSTNGGLVGGGNSSSFLTNICNALDMDGLSERTKEKHKFKLKALALKLKRGVEEEEEREEDTKTNESNYSQNDNGTNNNNENDYNFSCNMPIRVSKAKKHQTCPKLLAPTGRLMEID
ncbi:hypothetical protein H5410_000478 [Solanum commersonii]|uniref:Uncharacterized protein n=1 Tax=Solanum commersonii TaxID=4109 RepID=A0A9J6AWL7_SOLCO|nr:hypothetical protein H5410_000478 [Solanum commersonii]